MFWDDIRLVTEQVEKYGLRNPFVDLGGLERPCIADYDLTLETGDQQARYVSLSQRPFDHINRGYRILNPEKGDPLIEDLPSLYEGAFGTALCLNVLEHVENPFKAFEALYRIMKADCLLILGTVFSFPYHPSPRDYWRFTPDCLRYIGEKAGFRVLECDWRLSITGDKGILNPQNNEPAEIRSVYITLTKGEFKPHPEGKYVLPNHIPLTQNENPNVIGIEPKTLQAALPIVFIHLGDHDYLQYSLGQAKKSNPESTVHLIGDETTKHYDFVYHHHASEYFGGAEDFVKIYHHLSSQGYDLELMRFLRWFILRDFLVQNKMGRCFYLESDVMLYANVTEEQKKFSQWDFTLSSRCSGSSSFFNNLEALKEFCSYLMDIYTKRDQLSWDHMVSLSLKQSRNAPSNNVGDKTAFDLYLNKNRASIGETTLIEDGATYDHNVNLPDPDFEMRNGIKHVIWREGKPYGRQRNSGREIRFNVLHFQGTAKKYMRQVYENSNSKSVLINRPKPEKAVEDRPVTSEAELTIGELWRKLAQGHTINQLFQQYPRMTHYDVQNALRQANEFSSRQTAKVINLTKYEIAGQYGRIYHFHNEKTGGTSLNHTFLSLGGEPGPDVYKRLTKAIDWRVISGNKVFVGWDKSLIQDGLFYYAFSHIPKHQLKLPEDTFTITCLRDPVKRVLSCYKELMEYKLSHVDHPVMKKRGKWLDGSFGEYLARLPKELLQAQFYMFSKGFDIDEAFEEIVACSYFLFTEEFAAGLTRLSSKLGILLEPLHTRKTSIELDIPNEEMNRLREWLEPEYRLFERLRGYQADLAG